MKAKVIRKEIGGTTHRNCSKCPEFFEETGHSNLCPKCRKEYHKAYKAKQRLLNPSLKKPNRKIHRFEENGVTMVICTDCEAKVPDKRPESVYGRCAECHKAFYRKYCQDKAAGIKKKKAVRVPHMVRGCFIGVDARTLEAMNLGVNAFMKLYEK